ncbi:hypothetical protein C8Q78DRAFT_1183456 [Trametes maxima]|nr:hypothetical protein C8Q78DRAFT_1183456 [Trametes maxima]
MTSVEQTSAPVVEARDSGPLPMSFPAILRTPGLSDRFAHLRVPSAKSVTSAAARRSSKRDEKEGKRWVRRKENARFVGNAHIVAPSRKDYTVPLPNSRATFPQPLPNYLARNNAIPPAIPAGTEPGSANAGRFSLSLKGMRRELRKSGPRTELLVREVEDEIVAWLAQGGVMLAPDSAATTPALPGVPVGSSDAIRELSRTPLQLVWSTGDDAFTRYVVHCCARYHDVVSFSKDTSGQRLTYLLRPNVTRPSHRAAPVLDTPPTTDLSELSGHEFDTESELLSDRDLSDAEGPRPPTTTHYAGSSVPSMSVLDDEWSVIGSSDAEGDLSAPEGEGEDDGIERGVAALALSDAEPEADADRTFVADVRRRQVPEGLRSRLLERQRRAASSPSRSPARRTPRRGRRRPDYVHAEDLGRKSFYDYLFA